MTSATVITDQQETICHLERTVGKLSMQLEERDELIARLTAERDEAVKQYESNLELLNHIRVIVNSKYITWSLDENGKKIVGFAEVKADSRPEE